MARWTPIAALTALGLCGAPNVDAAEIPTLGVATRGLPVRGKRAAKLRKLVRDAAEERNEVALVDEARERRIFASAPPRDPKRAVARAERLTENGADALRNFDLADAERKLAQATKVLKPYLGLVESREADRKRIFLGVSLAHAQRNEEAMTKLLVEYATRYPETPPDDAGWPPDVLERLRSAAHIATSSIIVRSNPSGEAFVDGRPVGPTPTTVSPVPAGRHRVAIEAPGFYRATKWVDAKPGDASDVELPLLSSLGLTLTTDDGPAPAEETLAAIGEVAAREALDAVLLVRATASNRMIVSHVDTHGAPRVSAAFEVAATKDGARTALSQIAVHITRLEEKRETIPAWAWIGAGTGAAAVGAGVALRIAAVGTQDDLTRRTGAMTQTEAFDLRDRAESQARGGAILLGAGVAAIVGVASWVALDWVESDG